jgi:hypothetical protein
MEIIGEHKVTPNDFGLLESLRQRGFEVSFQETLESEPREPELVDGFLGQPEKGGL